MNNKKYVGINSIDLHELHFNINKVSKGKIDLKVEFRIDHKLSSDRKKMDVLLGIKITTDQNYNSFMILVEMIGRFFCDDSESEKILEDFAKINAIAIMIPYIREIITNINRKKACEALKMYKEKNGLIY